MDKKRTAHLVRTNEGTRLTVYSDTEGKKTVGTGFNLERPGAAERIKAVGAVYELIIIGSVALTEAQAEALFALDLDDAIRSAGAIVSNFDQHPDDVQSVIVDMVFNLGPRGFAGFKKTIAALEKQDYCTAAAQMADSAWAGQVPNRARANIQTVMRYCKS